MFGTRLKMINKKNKIYFASTWGLTPSELLDIYTKQTINRNGVWNNLIGTTNLQEADYIIVQDDTTESIDTSKVIFLGTEANHIIPKEISLKWKNSYKFFHHEFKNCWLPYQWWVDVDFDLDYTDLIKNKKFSIIDSGKYMYPGHKKRLKFINDFLNKYPNESEVWGTVCGKYTGIPPFKRELPDRIKNEGLLPYRYTLAIENGITDFYFSEKFCDAILCYTMPIYYGCKNIHKFFPEGSYVNIDINDKNAMERIVDVVNSDIREQNIEKIKEARHLLLYKYNVWPTIEAAIQTDKNTLI